jgi:hypothetical protein
VPSHDSTLPYKAPTSAVRKEGIAEAKRLSCTISIPIYSDTILYYRHTPFEYFASMQILGIVVGRDLGCLANENVISEQLLEHLLDSLFEISIGNSSLI